MTTRKREETLEERFNRFMDALDHKGLAGLYASMMLLATARLKLAPLHESQPAHRRLPRGKKSDTAPASREDRLTYIEFEYLWTQINKTTGEEKTLWMQRLFDRTCNSRRSSSMAGHYALLIDRQLRETLPDSFWRAFPEVGGMPREVQLVQAREENDGNHPYYFSCRLYETEFDASIAVLTLADKAFIVLDLRILIRELTDPLTHAIRSSEWIKEAHLVPSRTVWRPHTMEEQEYLHLTLVVMVDHDSCKGLIQTPHSKLGAGHMVTTATSDFFRTLQKEMVKIGFPKGTVIEVKPERASTPPPSTGERTRMSWHDAFE